MSIHFPKDEADFQRARDELAYEELFTLQYQGLKKKQASEAASIGKALAIPLDAELVKNILEKIPFPLTNHQKIATFQILKDMERNYAMNRLLQ
jgi:ATP-dependent DNA helicase RecG